MGNDVAIRAEGLGKSYRIAHQSNAQSSTLRDAITHTLGGVGRTAAELLRGRRPIPERQVEEFWALKGVNFSINQGDVVGIIGRNGAGKSTLLKVLSRITEPSDGRVEVRGRVASLLEVGTGFHPELTGRENIYLNGAILGMDHAEIRRKFDEIVDFAGVEKFLDTPVKRYSSGMYVRLAFSVAAHLEPEVLIVDEVLAVGDAEFQKKCLGKMQLVAGEGRTVLFVSHNLAAVERLCDRGLVFDSGALVFSGNIEAATSYYLRESQVLDDPEQKLVGSGGLLFGIEIMSGTASPISYLRGGDPGIVKINVRNDGDKISGVNVRLDFRNSSDAIVAMLESFLLGKILDVVPGTQSFTFYLPRVPFSAGFYAMSIHIVKDGVVLGGVSHLKHVSVEGGEYYGYGAELPPHIQVPHLDFDLSNHQPTAT